MSSGVAERDIPRAAPATMALPPRRFAWPARPAMAGDMHLPIYRRPEIYGVRIKPETRHGRQCAPPLAGVAGVRRREFGGRVGVSADGMRVATSSCHRVENIEIVAEHQRIYQKSVSFGAGGS